MSHRSPRKGLVLISIVAFSSFFAELSAAAEVEPPTDALGLEEIRSLSKLPAELGQALGWQHGDKDTIADFERQSETVVPKTVVRWFLVAGLRENYALVGMEERDAYSKSARFHANAFDLVGTRWVASGEWVLSSQPHLVGELPQLIWSPQSRALTAQWRKRQRDEDLMKRQMESEPTRRFRYAGSMREINITDSEVRQIEAVVQGLIPGSIVQISGVEKGCPCEDGPGCSAQAWAAVYRNDETYSLELSDINEHWVIGPVQRWYLKSAELERSKTKDSAAYSEARQEMDDRYPSCAVTPSGAQ